MSVPEHFDVAVVGAGPAGSSCATLLARAGLKVLLCDKSKFPRDKICGDCVNPRSWQFFELLGVTESVRALKPRHIDAVRVSGSRNQEVSFSVPSSQSAHFFTLQRSVLDNVLLKNAEKAGSIVKLGARVFDVSQSDQWSISARGEKDFHAYSCDYLVGADGRNSTVASKIASKSLSDSPLKNKERVGIQWHALFQSWVGNEIRLFLLKEGYCGIVNVSHDRANIAMVQSPSSAHLAVSDISSFVAEAVSSNSFLKQHAHELAPVTEAVTTFPINPIRRNCVEPNAFLVGDARQTVEPFTGEGICMALQDGTLAACTILSRLGKPSPGIVLSKSDFWVNRVFSPVLRNRFLSESLLSIAADFPWLSRILGKTVFGS